MLSVFKLGWDSLGNNLILSALECPWIWIFDGQDQGGNKSYNLDCSKYAILAIKNLSSTLCNFLKVPGLSEVGTIFGAKLWF